MLLKFILWFSWKNILANAWWAKRKQVELNEELIKNIWELKFRWFSYLDSLSSNETKPALQVSKQDWPEIRRYWLPSGTKLPQVTLPLLGKAGRTQSEMSVKNKFWDRKYFVFWPGLFTCCILNWFPQKLHSAVCLFAWIGSALPPTRNCHNLTNLNCPMLS